MIEKLAIIFSMQNIKVRIIDFYFAFKRLINLFKYSEAICIRYKVYKNIKTLFMKFQNKDFSYSTFL